MFTYRTAACPHRRRSWSPWTHMWTRCCKTDKLEWRKTRRLRAKPLQERTSGTQTEQQDPEKLILTSTPPKSRDFY